MRLPEGITTVPYIDKQTGELRVHVQYSREYINSVVLGILDERIARAKIALPLCKHTKRKHRLTKLLSALEQGRVRLDDTLPTHLESTDEQCNTKHVKSSNAFTILPTGKRYEQWFVNVTTMNV